MQKNKNRTGYKKTKVGWIPQSWSCLHLKDCANKIGSGITPKGGDAVYVKTGIPFIRSQNVLDGKFTSVGLRHITDIQHLAMKGSALQPNDVLFNITGASIGRSCVLPSKIKEANLNQHVCIIRLKNECQPPLYSGILNSHIAKRQLHENQAGGGREGLNFKNLGNFNVPKAPLSEQITIAGVLETWDRGIRQLEAKLATKRRIKKGLMQALLSCKKRLTGFGAPLSEHETGKLPEGWRRVKLSEVGVFSKGNGISKADLSDSGLPCLRYGEIYTTNDYFVKRFRSFISKEMATSATRMKHNDLLLAGSGETLGEIGKCIAYINTEEAYAGGDIVILSVSKERALADYLSYYLNTTGRKSLNRLGQGQSVVHIYSRDLKGVEIALPAIEEQRAIINLLHSAGRELDALERKLTNWKAQKKHLLNNMVDGTLRLPQFIQAEAN